MTKTSTGAVVSEQNKNPLTQVDASIRHARFSDRLATGALYAISGSFILLLIAMLSYILYNGIEAYSGTIFSFTDEGIGNQFFNTIYLVVISFWFLYLLELLQASICQNMQLQDEPQIYCR